MSYMNSEHRIWQLQFAYCVCGKSKVETSITKKIKTLRLHVAI